MNTSLKSLLATVLLKFCSGAFSLAVAAEDPVLVGTWPGFDRGIPLEAAAAVQGDFV